jgi:predicted alpha/beta-fold hydrolase
MKFFYALGFFVSSYALYKYKKKEKENNLLVVHSNSKLAKFFKMITDHFLETYADSFFLYTGHAQTFFLELCDLLLQFLRKYFNFFKFKYRREEFILQDGGTLNIDIAKVKGKEEAQNNKILLVLSGFTSVSEEYYIKYFLDNFVEEFDCRVLNSRGIGGKMTSPLMISSHCYSDIKEYLDYLNFTHPEKKVFCVGFSYGGMLLARCLGAFHSQLPSNLIGACGICYPHCLEQTKKYVETQLGGFYSKYSAKNLKKCFLDNVDVIFDPKKNLNESILRDKEIIIEKITNLNHVSDFDNIYTYRILNFETFDDYYIDSKLDPFLSKINIPFLSVFSQDDPIIPYEAIPLQLYQNNPNLVTIISKKGGHLGFFSGMIPHRWIDIPVKTFMKTVEIIHDVETK